MSKRQEIEHSPELSKPSKEGFIWLLRHPEIWNHALDRNYGNPCNCAIGVLYYYWGQKANFHDLQLSTSTTSTAFFGNHGGLSLSSVTPFIVADTLERLG